MERGLRRSKRAPAFEGVPHIPKLRIGTRFSSHPHSYVNENIRSEMSMEIGQRSFGRATDRPLASLRTKRSCKESELKIIHKESEPKRRSLSGIARLLRHEGLPSLWHSYKQKKWFLDSYRQNNTSIDLEPNTQLYDVSNRQSPKKHQEFKDVCEDLETSSYVSRRCSSRWSASSMLTKSDMAVIRKNLQSKRLTHEETASQKLQELDVTSDSIDSRDISLQSHRKQNPLLPKLVQDLRGTSSNPTTLLNPPNSAKYSNVISKISETELTGKHKTAYHPNSDDSLSLDPHDCYIACPAYRTPDTHLKERNKKNVVPTPIVLLRPIQENMPNGNDSSPYHSQIYSPNSRKVNQHHTAGCSKELSWRKTESYYDAEFFMPDYVEARKIANKITRHLRHACDENEDKMYTVYRRYLVVGDLYNAEKSDLNSELEMLKWSSRSSFSDDNKRSSHPSSGSANKEAKKRLAERWKITNRFRDLELVGKVSTLGEMFATPDGEERSRRTSHGRIDRSSTQLSDNENSMRHEFGGTINMAHLKNKTKRTSISRLVPPIGGKAHGRGTCHDILANEKHLLHTQHIRHGVSKINRQYPSHKDHFTSQGLRFRDKKPHLCPPIYFEEVNSSLEARFEIQMEANVKDLPHRQLSFQMREKDDRIWNDVSETVALEALLSETSLLHPNNTSANESSSSPHDQKDFSLQERKQGASEEGAPSLRYLGDELISLESSGADYASPVSVLEIPSVEDASSVSENFERVSAELNDLQIQLLLLKMEVSGYDDKSTLNFVERGSAHSCLRAESWEASYIVDVLICAGLDDFGFDLFSIMWHSPDCPLDPILFDILEEKYCNEMAGTRTERLLFFDRINSALSEIFQKYVDLMPKLGGSINLTWQKRRASDTVEKLIHQESTNTLHYAKRMLDRDMQWSDFTDEIALIGNEIEKLLLDELLNELLF